MNSNLSPPRKPWSHSVLMFLVTIFTFSLGQDITWVNQPPNPTFGVRDENVTLEWQYRLNASDRLSQFLLKRRENNEMEELVSYVASNNEKIHFNKKFVMLKHAIPSFMLINAQESDATEYCCRILTASGKKPRSCVELKILERPMIISISSNQTVTENENLTLSCNATGKPPPDVTWTKRGNKEWKHLGTILSIINISKVQHGETYSCTAKNNVSYAIASVTIAVNYAPLISLPSKSYNVTEGADTRLLCTSDGRPPPIVTWSKINGFNNSSYPPGQVLNISNINRTEAGKYQCTAKNSVGKEAIATIYINVIYPPTIVRRTSTQILNETGELRLECHATGNPRPFITWTKVPDPTPLDSPDGVLTIYKANKTHSGIYQCRASNGVGRDATTLSSVRFNYKPVETRLRSYTKDDRVIVGNSVTFSCTAESNPPPNLEIRLNDVSLGFFKNNTFTLQDVNTSYGGTYECVPWNMFGYGPIATVNLTVQVPPSIDFISHEVTVNETENVTIFCNASGIPKPVVTWTFLGNSSDGMESVNLESLSLPRINRRKAGRYRCKAANGVANPKSAHVDIKVNHKPEIEHVGPSREITSWLNHETTLTCKAAGFPLPEIKWSHDGAVEYSVQGYSCTSILRFTPRQASDFDVVVCMAKNILGSAEAKVTVKQLNVPDPPEILRIDEGLNNLKIHWKESTTKPKFSILSYMVQVKEKGESHEWINCTQIENQTGSMMCRMDELKSNTEYIVRVSARNVVGFSEFTMREVSTKEPTVKEKQQGLPGSSVHWIIAGVTIGFCVVLLLVAAVALKRRSRGRGEVTNVNDSGSQKVTITSYNNPTMEESLQTVAAVIEGEQSG